MAPGTRSTTTMTAVTSSSISSSPETENPLKQLAKYKKQEIGDALKKMKVPYKENAKKDRLSALYALGRLGLLNKKKTANENLLDLVGEWCMASVEALMEDVRVRELNDKTGTKWDYVRVLIIDEHAIDMDLETLAC